MNIHFILLLECNFRRLKLTKSAWEREKRRRERPEVRKEIAVTVKWWMGSWYVRM